jgi:hypothetical protein
MQVQTERLQEAPTSSGGNFDGGPHSMQPARESGRAGRIPCPLASRLRLGWEEGVKRL